MTVAQDYTVLPVFGQLTKDLAELGHSIEQTLILTFSHTDHVTRTHLDLAYFIKPLKKDNSLIDRTKAV